jgi:hypothetical protein
MLRKENVLLTATCIVIAAGSAAGALIALIRGEVGVDGLDGIFLVLVCLLFAAAFGMLVAQAVRQGTLKELLKARKPAPAPPKQENEVPQTQDAARST